MRGGIIGLEMRCLQAIADAYGNGAATGRSNAESIYGSLAIGAQKAPSFRRGLWSFEGLRFGAEPKVFI
jgi:hypothetical protein